MSLRLLALLALVSPLNAADAPVTLLAQPDKEIVSDALTKDAKAAEWKIAKGKWERTAEGIRVEELPDDKHGAAGRDEAAEKIGERGAVGAGHAAGEAGERRDYGRVVKGPLM